jgi:hypothetical protein
MPINWSKIKQLLMRNEELTYEDVKELEKEFRADRSDKLSDEGTNDVEVLRAILEKSNQEIDALRRLIEEERQEKEKRENEIKEQLKKELEKKKAEAMDKLIKAAVLAPSDEEGKQSWEKLLDADYNAAITLVEKQINAAKNMASKEEPTKSQERWMSNSATSRSELINLAKNEFKVN